MLAGLSSPARDWKQNKTDLGIHDSVNSRLEAHEHSIEMEARADAQIIELLGWESPTEDSIDIQIAEKRLAAIKAKPDSLLRGAALLRG